MSWIEKKTTDRVLKTLNISKKIKEIHLVITNDLKTTFKDWYPENDVRAKISSDRNHELTVSRTS